MQLKIQRSQRPNTWGAVLFCIDIRADYSAEERDNINKYRLGALLIYSSQAAQRHQENSKTQLTRSADGNFKDSAVGLARGMFSVALAKMALNVSIASLSKGHHIECKDLQELLEAEETLRNACKDLTRYLEVASTFNGSELIIRYENGEERVHIAENAPPLVEFSPATAPEARPPRTAGEAPWFLFETWVIDRMSKRGATLTPRDIRIGFALFTLVIAVFLVALL